MELIDNAKRKWRERKEKNKRINEAIEKRLSLEHQLAIHRLDEPRSPIMVVYGGIVILVLVIGILALAANAVGVSAMFENHVGENVWENLEAVAEAKADDIFRDDVILIIEIGFLAVISMTMVSFLYRNHKWNKKYSQLKEEILDKLDRGK